MCEARVVFGGCRITFSKSSIAFNKSLVLRFVLRKGDIMPGKIT
jgi:hypothetical protein